MKYFDPTIPGTKSKLQSKAIRDNFNALNERTDQLTVYATVPPSTAVYIKPADKVYFNNNFITTFPGQILNLGDSVNGVYNFTNQHYYKEIIIYYYYDIVQNVSKVDFIEGFEIQQPIFNTESIVNNYNYQFKNGVRAQYNILQDTIILCSILVQNNGLVNQRGQIKAITNDNIVDLRPYLSKVYTDTEIKRHINTLKLSEAHPNAKILNENIESIIAVNLDDVNNSNTIRINKIFLWDGTQEKKDNIKEGDLLKIPVDCYNVNTIDNSTLFITCNVLNINYNTGVLTLNKNITINSGNLIIKPLITYDKLAYTVSNVLLRESNILKKQDNNYILNDGIVFDSNIANNANIDRGKIKSGAANAVVINDSNGILSEEQYLSKSRGGIGKNAEQLEFPDIGTIATLEGEEVLINKQIILKNGSQINNSLKFESNHGLYSNNNSIIIKVGDYNYSFDNDGYFNLDYINLQGKLINGINIETFKLDFDNLLLDYNNHKLLIGNNEIHHIHTNYNNLNSINQNLSTNSNVQFLNLYLNGELDINGKLYLNYNNNQNRYYLPTTRGENNNFLVSNSDESTTWKSINDLNLIVCDTQPIDGYATVFYNNSKKLKSSKLYIDNDGNISCNLINNIDIVLLYNKTEDLDGYISSNRVDIDELGNRVTIIENNIQDIFEDIDDINNRIDDIPIYNQSLNTTDNVQFNDVIIDNTLYINNKISFFNSAPTTKLNLNTYTPLIKDIDYLGDDGYALITELNDLRQAYENLRQAYDDLRQKLITYGLF